MSTKENKEVMEIQRGVMHHHTEKSTDVNYCVGKLINYKIDYNKAPQKWKNMNGQVIQSRRVGRSLRMFKRLHNTDGIMFCQTQERADAIKKQAEELGYNIKTQVSSHKEIV